MDQESKEARQDSWSSKIWTRSFKGKNPPRVCIPRSSSSAPSSLSISEDLEGLKVSHDFDELAEGNARIPTLKDSHILDNKGNISHHSPFFFPFSHRHPEDEL